jgi:hypothetical protein
VEVSVRSTRGSHNPTPWRRPRAGVDLERRAVDAERAARCHACLASKLDLSRGSATSAEVDWGGRVRVDAGGEQDACCNRSCTGPGVCGASRDRRGRSAIAPAPGNAGDGCVPSLGAKLLGSRGGMRRGLI